MKWQQWVTSNIYHYLTSKMTEEIIIAAGCFWGVEKLYKELDGVINTQVGYLGGTSTDPTYEQICKANTGHYEAVKIEFDNSKIQLKEVLKYFFTLHDPTQTNGQHNDIGDQYKSAIFVSNDEQENIAQKLIESIEERKIFQKSIATKILKKPIFYVAEQYHQDYLNKKPDGYMCHYISKTIDLSDI